MIMNKAKRAFVIVLDSFGIGYEPDAHLFGDVGANTLESVARTEDFNINNMVEMGLGSIDGVRCLPATDMPTASHARLRELSMGKDTTVGHWELMGIVSERPLPTYPDGFPKEIIDKFSEILEIKPGQTSKDGMFTIDALRCIGACGIAPAVSINGKVYPKMTVDKVQEVVDTYRKAGGAAV